MLDLLNDIRDTHTYDYFVSVNGDPRHLQHLRTYYQCELDPQTGQYTLSVTSWSRQERKELQCYLRQHAISYTVDRVLKPSED